MAGATAAGPRPKGHFRPRGIIVDHHTGTTSSASRPAPSLQPSSAAASAPCPAGPRPTATSRWASRSRPTAPLPAAQHRSIAVTNAVVPRHSGRSDPGRYVWRHKDISLTGKWDSGQLTNRAVSQAPVTS
jgi:hypothetical protein